MKKSILIILSLMLLFGCDVFLRPEEMAIDNNGYINTIPGTIKSYSIYEIEGMSYYYIHGQFVCPERDKAIIELVKSKE